MRCASMASPTTSAVTTARNRRTVQRDAREGFAEMGCPTRPADPVHCTRIAMGDGSCESFNGKLKDDCLSQEIFYSLKEMQTLIGIRQSTYNRVRQHSLLGHRPPAPVTAPELASGYPWPPRCSSLSMGSVQNIGQVTGRIEHVVAADHLSADQHRRHAGDDNAAMGR